MHLPFGAERRQLRSRVHGPRQVLRELQRIRAKVDRAQHLEVIDLWADWLRRVADHLDRDIAAGNAIGPGFADPRWQRKAYKRRREDRHEP